MANAAIDTKEGKQAFAESWENICAVMSALEIIEGEPVQRRGGVISAWRAFRANREDMEMLAQNRNYGSPFALMLASGMDECVFELKMVSQRKLRNGKTIDTGLCFFFPSEVRDCNFAVFADVPGDAAVDEYAAAVAELANFTANRTPKRKRSFLGKKFPLLLKPMTTMLSPLPHRSSKICGSVSPPRACAQKRKEKRLSWNLGINQERFTAAGIWPSAMPAISFRGSRVL